MSKASSLLLLTLVLNVHLCSSAPIPANVVAPEDHSHSIQKRESLGEKLIPVAAGEAALSPEESPAEDIPVTAKEPEPVSIGDDVSDDADAAKSQKSDPQSDPTAPKESSEKETLPVDAAFAEESPEETPEEVDPVVAVESESTEQNYVDDVAPEAPIPVIPLEASEDEVPEGHGEEEDALEEPFLIVPDDTPEVEEKSVSLIPAEEPAAEETAPEESAPEEPDVVLPVESAEQKSDQEEEEETVSIILPETKEEEVPGEHASEEEAIPKVLEINPEEDPATNEELLLSALEEQDSVALLPTELEDQVEPAVEETEPEESAPEEPVVIVPVETGENEQEETVSIILPETKDEEAPEDPVVIVTSDTTEEEPELEEQVKEETITTVSIEAPEEEAPEEYTKVEDAGGAVLIVPEEDAEEDLATNEEPLPSTLEEQESVALFPIEGEDQVEPAVKETEPEESAPEEPVVIVPVETGENEQEETVSIILPETKDEEAPEDPVVIVTLDTAEGKPELEGQVAEESIPIVSPKAPEEEVPEEHTEVEDAGGAVLIVPEEDAEEDLATNEEPLPSTLEEEESVALFPIEGEDQVEPVVEETEPEGPVVIIPLDPAEQEPELEGQVTEESIPIVSSEASEGEAPEEHAEVEDAVVPVSIVPEKDAEEDPATNEEPLPSTPEESVVLVHPETDKEEEAAAEETAREQPAVIVPVEPTSEEPTAEDPILIIPVEDLEEDAPEHNTEDEVVVSDPLPKEAVPELDTAPEENEAGDSNAEIIVTTATGTPSEAEDAEIVLDPGEEVVAIEVVPAITDGEAGSVPTPVEGGNGTSIDDFQAALILIEEEPEVMLNRGAVLGAAFFTLMSFIIIGFIWTTVSKKLR